jgi:hypothetical protein
MINFIVFNIKIKVSDRVLNENTSEILKAIVNVREKKHIGPIKVTGHYNDVTSRIPQTENKKTGNIIIHAFRSPEIEPYEPYQPFDNFRFPDMPPKVPYTQSGYDLKSELCSLFYENFGEKKVKKNIYIDKQKIEITNIDDV